MVYNLVAHSVLFQIVILKLFPLEDLCQQITQPERFCSDAIRGKYV